MTDIEVRKNLIHNTESGWYPSVNEDGEDVLVMLDKGVGMDVRTEQSNGWIRVDSYDADGYFEGDSFDGRWNKN